jgi:hypothetical protein
MKSCLPKYDNEKCSYQDSQIKRERELSHIVQVVLPSLAPAHLSSPVYLRKSRQTRLNLEALYAFPVVIGHLLWQRRSRTNQRHVSLQNVQQLWQLIQFEAPQERTHNGNLGVTFPYLRVLAAVTMKHRPKLVCDEYSAELSEALLFEKNRTPRRESYKNYHRREKW